MDDSTLLGLAVDVCVKGLSPALRINADQSWTKYVRDLRPDLKWISNLTPATEVLLYTAVPEGEFYVCLRQTGDARPDDYTAAWIFVSWYAQICGEELLTLIDNTQKAIRGTINQDYLNHEYAIQYPVLDVPRVSICTTGSKPAVRYYGRGCSYSIKEILSAPIAQAYNSGFSEIILLDKASGAVATSECEDITKRRMDTPVLVCPPEAAGGFKPYYNGALFAQSTWLCPGSKVEIEWRRSGYQPIKKTETVKEPMAWSSIQPSEIKRAVDHRLVFVQDCWGQSINGYDLYIGGTKIEQGKNYYINEAALSSILVEIMHEDFESFKGNLNLLNDRPVVKLKNREFSYTFIFDQEDGSKSMLDVSSKKRIDSCPIPGYEFDKNNSNATAKHLIPQSGALAGPDLKTLIIVFLTGCILGVAACWVISSLRPLTKEKETITQPISSPANSDQQQASNALAKDVWNKTELESHTATKGLWDALNKYDLSAALTIANKISSKPENLRKVIDAINESKQKSIHLTGPYCEEGDFDITVANYIRKIKTKPAESTPDSQPTSSQQKNNKLSGGNDGDKKSNNNNQEDNNPLEDFQS